MGQSSILVVGRRKFHVSLLYISYHKDGCQVHWWQRVDKRSILANNIGEGRGVKIDHASTLRPVKRRFLIFCVLTPNKESLGKYICFLFDPIQHSSPMTYS